MLRVEELRLPNQLTVNFTLRPKEAVILRGDNGSGKSLLLKVLSRLISAPAKSFVYENHPVSSWKPESYRSEVMYLGPQVFPGRAETAEEFLRAPFAFGIYKNQERQFDISLWVEKWNLKGDFSRLSSGQRQLLNVLRVFQLKARVLLLDEITANLDSEKTQAVELLLKKWLDQTGGSLVFVGHSQEQATRLGWKVIELSSLYINSASESI